MTVIGSRSISLPMVTEPCMMHGDYHQQNGQVRLKTVIQLHQCTIITAFLMSVADLLS
jgi:hypothetical protein